MVPTESDPAHRVCRQVAMMVNRIEMQMACCDGLWGDPRGFANRPLVGSELCWDARFDRECVLGVRCSGRAYAPGGAQPISGFVVVTENLDFRSVSLLAKLLHGWGVLRQQFEHPVHPEDVVLWRDDREAGVPNPLRVVLQSVDDLPKVNALDFESFDAAEIMKIAKR